MPGFTSQLKDIIARNIESVIEAATNPARILTSLQREIEEAIIALEGDRSLARARLTRLEARIAHNEQDETDWTNKARAASEHGREDLARQALMAREACSAAAAKARQDLAGLHRELAEIEAAMADLEAKRADTIDRARAQAEVDAANASVDGARDASGTAGKTDALRSRIAELERRSQFAAERIAAAGAAKGAAKGAAAPQDGAQDGAIEAVRDKRRIDKEIDALKRARSDRRDGSDDEGV